MTNDSRNKKIYTAVIITAVLITGALVFLPEGYDEYHYKFKFDEPSLEIVATPIGRFTSVNLKGCSQTDDVGYPNLPIYKVKFVIPNGKEVKDIRVKTSEAIEINLDYPVVPTQRQEPCGDLPTKYPWPFEYEDCGCCENYINKTFEKEDVMLCRGYPILELTLYPIDYIPGPQKLLYYKDINIEIEMKDGSIIGDIRGLEEDKEYITNIVNNPGIIGTYRNIPLDIYTGGLCDSSDSYDYVIVTSQELVNDWVPLKNHRESDGYSSIIISVQDIDNCIDYWNSDQIFNDSQAHIREFCKDAYQDWGTQYILFGGDWGPQDEYKIVPARTFHIPGLDSYTYYMMPTDIYYSNLDGDFYDYSENVFGGGPGDQNDKYSELYVGRICVYDSDTVANAINKIIWYDNCNDVEWLKTIGFWGGNLGWTSTGKQYMEALRKGDDCFSEYVGFEEWLDIQDITTLNTSSRLYHEDLGSSYKSYCVASIENDEISVINHLDHSSWNSPLSLTSWSSRYNTKPFFAWSQGCLAGRYTSGFSGSEQLQARHFERHAFALVLNTGYGFGSGGSTCGKSQHQHKIFWNYFFDIQQDKNEWQLGKAHTYQKDFFSNYISYSVSCYVWYGSCYFGDPAQKLNFPDDFDIHNISLEPGYHTVNWYGQNSTTLKNISEWNLKQQPPEWVGIWNISINDYDIWIPNTSPESYNRVVNYMDEIYIAIYGTTKYLNT